VNFRIREEKKMKKTLIVIGLVCTMAGLSYGTALQASYGEPLKQGQVAYDRIQDRDCGESCIPGACDGTPDRIGKHWVI
jgi:hypothetical protein